MACDYSTKFIPLIVAKAAEFGDNNIALQEWFTKWFHDGKSLYTRYVGGTLFNEEGASNSSRVPVNPYYGRFTLDTHYDSVSDYYKGANDLQILAEQRFKEEIVRRIIFDRTEEDSNKRWKHPDSIDDDNVSQINKDIAKYKEDLCNTLLSEVDPEASRVQLTSELSDTEFTTIIQTVLSKYRQFLSTNPESVNHYMEFVTLSMFDELLRAHAPFIEPQSEFIDKVSNKTVSTDSFNKYEYRGPTVKHYTGYTSSEFAAIENQDSDLAKLLLETIPDINDDGTPIPGSFIGLSGFNASMMAMKNWILFESPKAIRDEYYKGAKADISKLITAYIAANKQLGGSTKNIYSDRTTFLNSKLKSIQKHIFGDDSDALIKTMFANMLFKTEPISYRTYSFDADKGEITGSNLKSSFINAQKFNVEDIVRSVTYLTKTSPSHKAGLLNGQYKVDYNKGIITISGTVDGKREYLNVTLTKERNKGATGEFIGNASDKFKKQVIKDFLMFIVPDTYEQIGKSIESDDWDWANDFAPFVGVVAFTALGRTNSAISWKRGNILDLSNFTEATLRIAKKLSTIYGSETRNVVKNLSGSNLPLYQLTNLTYNLQSIIDGVVDSSQSDDPEYYLTANKNNILVQARELLISPQIRQEVRYGNVTKSASELTVKELLQLNVLHDFYEGFSSQTDSPAYGKIYLQSATYADKSTHYLFGYDLNKRVTINGQDVNLFEVIKDVIDGKSNSDQLIEIIRKTRASRINNIVSNILRDYREVYEGKETFDTIDDLIKFLATKKYDDVVKDFKDARVTFYEEIHGYKPKYKGAPSIAFNETILNQYRTYNSPELFKQRLDKSRKSFINSIDSNYWKWNKYDNPIFEKIYKDKRFEAFKGPNGTINTHIGDTLNPILEAYFLTDVLLSNEVNSLLIGEVFAHPNKNKRTTLTSEQYAEEKAKDPNFDAEVGTYEEFSEANRLIAQIKRSVAFGATYHPYIQNLENGVASYIRIAVIEDIKGIVFTPNGDENAGLDSSDGSGIAHPLESRFENNSLVDARVGANKKSIMMDIDPHFGRPTLLKWAVYELSNEYRRNGYFSKANTENVYRKMSDGDLSNFITVEQLNQALAEYGNLCFKDIKSGQYFRITGFEATQTGVKQKLVSINPNTFEEENETTRTLPLTTLYDYDQALGGAWTGEFKDGEWIYKESQLDILEKLMSKNDGRKNTFIGYLVNKSAIKVGAGNVNSSDSWKQNNSDPFTTIRMRTKYGGVQMDADHELDLAQVTEMTQMISALIEDGHYKDIVESIYKDIGGVVASHVAKLNDAVKQVLETGSPESRLELYKIVAESWIGAFEKGNKDTIGIAQAFVKKASDAFRKSDFNTKIPFSAATINGSFVSDVISSINKGGIRHKYEGYAGVLNPSHDMIQYYKVYNPETHQWEVRLFDEFADFVRNQGVEVSYEAVNDPKIVNGEPTNPLLKETSRNLVDFEDTVLVLDENGNIVESTDKDEPQFWYVNSFTTYDSLKSLLRKHSNYRVYIHTGKPRNLKASNTKFKVNGHWFSIYDLDSVRASQYLFKAIKDFDSITPDKIRIIKRALGWRFNYQELFDNPNARETVLKSLIKRCNSITQDTLKRIEQKQSFVASEAFEIYNSTTTEDGTPIKWNSLQWEIASRGASKSIDREQLVSKLSTVEERTDLANWLINLLHENTTIDTLPITVPDAIKNSAQQVSILEAEYDRLVKKRQDFGEGNLSEIAKARLDYLDAFDEFIDRLCSYAFDIDLEYIVRPISKWEAIKSLNVTADDYMVEAAEIIGGKYQGEKFGLGENDHIWQINSSDYFYNKLLGKYNALPEFTESELFDAILFGNNEQFLVKIGQIPTDVSGQISQSTDFREINGRVYYQGNDLGSSENKRFFTYIDENGGKHHIIQVSTIDDFRNLKKRSLFDNVIRYNWTADNLDTLKQLKYGDSEQAKIYTNPENQKESTLVKTSELTLDQITTDECIRLDKRIRRQADDMYDSFQKQLNYVGARIPTQAMQSFMAMKLIAFTKVKENAVYVPKSQTYLEGSDYWPCLSDYKATLIL